MRSEEDSGLFTGMLSVNSLGRYTKRRNSKSLKHENLVTSKKAIAFEDLDRMMCNWLF